MNIPDDWEQELMLHEWKMMKISQYQLYWNTDFFLNIYEFPNGIRLNLTSSMYVRIYAHKEFSPLIEKTIEDWEYEKKDAKKEDTVEYRAKTRAISKGIKMRKDMENLLWDLFSLIS